MARFYIEGDEIDVQDNSFYFPKEEATEKYKTIETYLIDYA